ncbi:hypothetical protein EES46_06540 [Streptomyces sp. ADI98-10]|nr:hypothetical protein EES46_06540 [Streptomyces sp. ADI98-10]
MAPSTPKQAGSETSPYSFTIRARMPLAGASESRRVGEGQHQDGLRALEREPLPDLQAGRGHQAPWLPGEGVIALGRQLGRLGAGGAVGQNGYS